MKGIWLNIIQDMRGTSTKLAKILKTNCFSDGEILRTSLNNRDGIL